MIVGAPRTLCHELEAQARALPTKTWLIYEDRDGTIQHFTYAEFARRAYRPASVLADLGVRPGDKVMVHLTNCPEFLELWFGAATMGAIVVPVNTLSSVDELE